MVNALFSVKHNHCGLCEAQAPLFILNLTRKEKPVLEPKPENTHTGICLDCWRDVVNAINPRIKSYEAKPGLIPTGEMLLGLPVYTDPDMPSNTGEFRQS